MTRGNKTNTSKTKVIFFENRGEDRNVLQHGSLVEQWGRTGPRCTISPRVLGRVTANVTLLRLSPPRYRQPLGLLMMEKRPPVDSALDNSASCTYYPQTAQRHSPNAKVTLKATHPTKICKCSPVYLPSQSRASSPTHNKRRRYIGISCR